MIKVNTLEKGLNILLLFDDKHPVMSVPDIASRLKLPESTTYRYVTTLKSYGLIEEDTKPGYYCLGLEVLRLAEVVRKRLSIVEIALPIMKNLLRETEETILLTTIFEQKAICVERVESKHSLRLSFERGKVMFLHAGASAKILLAYLDDDQQDRIIKDIGLPRFTENTITDPEVLKADLKNIRKNGFAISSEEVDPGACAIAAPILNGRGKIIAGLSIAGPISRINGDKIDRFIDLVKRSAKKISKISQGVDSVR